MLFRQFVDDDLGCASYLIGDEAAGEAVVVDPAYSIEPYLETADREGLRIVRVLETHNHADHVSGHGRLALERDVPVAIHELADVAYPCNTLADGQSVTVLVDASTQVRERGKLEQVADLAVGERAMFFSQQAADGSLKAVLIRYVAQAKARQA